MLSAFFNYVVGRLVYRSVFFVDSLPAFDGFKGCGKTRDAVRLKNRVPQGLKPSFLFSYLRHD
jgi:hypothetical protein